MPSILGYVVAAVVGVLLAHFLSRAPELRSMRLSQLIFVPIAMVVGYYLASSGSVEDFICGVAVIGFLAMLLAPNIAYHCGAALSNFLDPHDWTSAEEEIALRPIIRLIDKDQYREALAGLDELLQKHKPTYEALLLKAKLLHHFGSVDETVATLLGLIELSHTTEQQLAVMELLALLEPQHRSPPRLLVPGTRRIEIRHELVIYQTTSDAYRPHKAIPPGSYEVEEIFLRNHCWLKLAGEDWGNAEMCWEAIRDIHCPDAAPPKKGPFWHIARMHQAITLAIKGKPRRQQQAEAKKLLHEANQHIRNGDWQAALPLLQKASAFDPDRYEIAYRWAQAVRQTANDLTTAQIVNQIMKQSQWTESAQQMLQQLKRPLAK